MRGVISYAMVMCAFSNGRDELLDPPPGAVPGDRIICEGYPGTPDEQLSQKKKVKEGDMFENENCASRLLNKRIWECPYLGVH